MISDKMVGLVNNSSVIRAMFEEGKRLANIYGAENVYDFSLGNPSVNPPRQIKDAIKSVVDEEDENLVHGYMNNSGYEDVRDAVKTCKNASIRPIMITGDNKDTALAIGKEVGLITSSNDLILTSTELNNLTTDEIKNILWSKFWKIIVLIHRYIFNCFYSNNNIQ